MTKITIHIRPLLLVALLLGGAVYHLKAQTPTATEESYEIFGEQIVIIGNSGTNYISFVTTRTPFVKTGWSLDKDTSLNKFLENFLYLNPVDFDWDDKSSPIYNYFTFSKGSYGTILKGSFETNVSLKNNETFFIKDGVYSYKNEDGVKELNGSYGINYENYGFSQFTYAWILPEEWEFVEHSSESEGEWKALNNTLIFIGTNVNNLVFNIQYRRKISDSLTKIKNEIELDKNKDIEIKEVENGLQIIFSEKIFFQRGKYNLNPSGEKLLDKVAYLMQIDQKLNIQVHGHTDNTPFKAAKRKVSNNWELSAFRALSIVNYLTQKKSLPGERLEVRAYGEYRPVSSNDTTQGKAENRRIEIFLMEK